MEEISSYGKQQNTTIHKKAMIEALTKSLGIVTTACKIVGIERSTHYDWLKLDEDYRHQVESIKDVALDFAESKLHKMIEDGNTACVIFYLKTKGKGRGYVEKYEHDLPNGIAVQLLIPNEMKPDAE